MAYEIPQTTVTQYPAAALQGMLGDNGPVDIFSAVVSESGGLDAGLGVILDTAQAQVPGYALKAKLPVDVNSLIAGFTVYRSMGVFEPSGARYPLTDDVNLLRKGRIWVLVQNTVAQGDDVFVWYAASGGTKGAIRSDAGSTQAVRARGCKVVRGAATGSFALVDANIPATSDEGTTINGGSLSVVGPKTANYTANIGELVKVDSTGGVITITTPTAVGNAGRSFVLFTGPAAATNNVTLDGNASETVNGAATKVFSANNVYVTVTSDGTNWLAG